MLLRCALGGALASALVSRHRRWHLRGCGESPHAGVEGALHEADPLLDNCVGRQQVRRICGVPANAAGAAEAGCCRGCGSAVSPAAVGSPEGPTSGVWSSRLDIAFEQLRARGTDQSRRNGSEAERLEQSRRRLHPRTSFSPKIKNHKKKSRLRLGELGAIRSIPIPKL